MTTTLVTGSEGSLMQAVIPRLIAQGHEVIGVDNLSRHGKRGTYSHGRYRFVETDARYCENIFLNVPIDYVINGAATIYGVGGFNAYCGDILINDIEIQASLLREAHEHKVKKFIYISSSMVYESVPPKDELENDNGSQEFEVDLYPPPQTDYGLSKYVGERMCGAYYKQYGLDYTIWRPFNIITPFELFETGQGHNHVFADFIHQIIGEKVSELPIIGDGEQVRCFTWIDDVADAIAYYSFQPPQADQFAKIFNIGSKQNVTMKELAQKIKDIGYRLGLCDGGKLTFKTVKEYPHDVRHRIPSTANMRLNYRWNATKTLDESLEECIWHYARSKIKW